MKKTVLFILLSATILNGVETHQNGHYTGDLWENIPQETKSLIISYLNTYNNLDEIINTIKATGMANLKLSKMIKEQYGNPKGFRDLVQLLANKFPEVNPKTIAEKFGTSAAKNYEKLSEDLHQSFKLNNFITAAESLIQQGADVNYQSVDQWPLLYKAIIKGDIAIIEFLLKNNADSNITVGPKKKALLPEEESPLILVAWRRFTPTTLEIIKLFLKHGADVHFKNSKGNTALDVWTKLHRDDSPEVEALLTEATKK